MTGEAMRAERERILEKIHKHKLEIELLRTRLHHMRAYCKHPHGRSYTDLGGVRCTYCPDCGGD